MVIFYPMATKKASTAERRAFWDQAFCAALTGYIVKSNGTRIAPYGLARLAAEQADVALRLRAAHSGGGK